MIRTALEAKDSGVVITEEPLASYAIEPGCADSIELQPFWFQLLQKHLPQQVGLECKVILAKIKGKTTGALPLMRSRDSVFGVPLRKIQSITGVYTSLFSPLFDDNADREGDVSRHLLDAVTRKNDWDMLEIGPMDEDSPAVQNLHRSAMELGLYSQLDSAFANWHLTLQNTGFTDYMQQRPGALKNTLKRKKAALDKKCNWRMERCVNTDTLARCFRDYEKVYASSWKALESAPDFIKELCFWAAGQGFLRLGLLYVDEAPAAAQIWFVLNRRAAIFKLAYDERFKSASVGSILTEFMMSEAITGDAVETVDYGKGGEAYKADWMSASRERVNLTVFNKNTVAGRLAWLRYALLPRAKRQFWRRGD